MSLEQEALRSLPQEISFLLYDVLGLEGRSEHAPFYDAAHQLAESHFLSLAAELDANEPQWVNGKVEQPASLKVAIDAFLEGGFLSAPFPEDIGGLGLPYIVHQAMMAPFQAVNAPVMAYPLLGAAAANLLRIHGSEEQKQRYMRPLIEGRYMGTMCLSEPQAGSSLADITTRAVPQSDGSYHLVGNKMWISGGDHELSENIIHLVLAKLPDAPAGTRGISLFIVPKYHINADGSRAEPNGVQLTGLNHKMGFRGIVNTALSFGDDAPAVGFLVGEAHRGLTYMFHMMNEARIGVGQAASIMGYAGYRASLKYAEERSQGRNPDSLDPTNPPVSILEHADVRRMLLTQKVYSEGALALMFYCSKLIDELYTAPAEAHEAIQDLLDILTPIAKAWPSDYGLKANELAIQVAGGYGYTRDYPFERYYRDNRLNAIHEGTNGIQGLDLLGRKITQYGGRRFVRLTSEIQQSIAKHREDQGLAELCDALEAAVTKVVTTTQALGQAAMTGEVKGFLANSTEYLHMLGHVVIAWMWLEQAGTASRLLQANADNDYLKGKIHAAHFFTRYELTRIDRQAALLSALDKTALNMPTAGF